MSDTTRTMAQILTLFADNVTGAITPQMLRDFVVSTGMVGTGVYDDVLGGNLYRAANGNGGVTVEGYRDTEAFRVFFRHNTNAALTFDFQFPHKFEGGAVYPHIHYIGMAGVSGNVILRVSYLWSNTGDEDGALVDWTALPDFELSVLDTHQYVNKVLTFGEVPAYAGAGASSFLNLRVERRGGDAEDTYSEDKDHGTGAANFCVRAIDVHALTTRSGTLTEF